jgi:hypothetical protein
MSAARKTDSSGSSVSSDSATPDEGIHRCDTVPPPDGETDAYNAPTKIGPMARGMVDQLMAQAEAMQGIDSTPPKSGERPLPARKPKPSDPPVVVSPVPAPQAALPAPPAPEGIARMYDASDEGDTFDPTSLLGEAQAQAQGQPQQSGSTKLLEVSVVSGVASIAPAPMASVPSTPPVAVASSSPPIASQTIAAQLDAYNASAPVAQSSDARLVFAVCLVVTLGLAALYFFFLAA